MPANCSLPAEAEQDVQGSTTHRPAKPEARLHRRPHTTSPAEGSVLHEERYERRSAAYVDVEWEDSPANGTKVSPCSTRVFLVDGLA